MNIVQLLRDTVKIPDTIAVSILIRIDKYFIDRTIRFLYRLFLQLRIDRRHVNSRLTWNLLYHIYDQGKHQED